MNELYELINKISDAIEQAKFLVIGDVMLDQYVSGAVSRISPEAPVPVVHVESEANGLGGAANVASNLASFGCPVHIIGVVGNDEQKDLLAQEFQKKLISYSMIVDPSRPTTVKQRIVSKNHQLLRMDQERAHDINPDVEEQILKEVNAALPKTDIIVLSDYLKGILSEKIATIIIALANQRHIPVVADIKPKQAKAARYNNATLITLNKEEAYELHGEKDEIEQVGKALVRKFNSNVIITRGPEGISVFAHNYTHHVQTAVKRVFDISGAGDTVTATLALALVHGADLRDAAVLANHAAGIVVNKPGIATLTLNELKAIFRSELAEHIRENIEVKQFVLETQMEKIDAIAKKLIEACKNNKKILTFGNGGSACDAEHLATELIARYKMSRNAFAAISLNSSGVVLTNIANDWGYDFVFQRQVEALAQPGDVVVGISTSGKSASVNNGLEAAKKRGAYTIALGGKSHKEDGGKMVEIADLSIVVPSNHTPRIQETHITIIHAICEILENELLKQGVVSIQNYH
ncbi:SIS domain-containing protein [Candidatus Woesearchaeota archaeon]|nr:SIS domain-containing protein [Candidatus Woesearchaeota archaeon]